MSDYRRYRHAGGTYFFTVNLASRASDILTARVEDLRAAFASALIARPFSVDAIVVLPGHLHTVWTLPEGDCDFSRRWKQIKTVFTRRTGLSGHRSVSKEVKGERGLWQRRFREHLIRDEADFWAHVAYCWGNPVKHGLCERAVDWPFSSIHRDMRLGWVPPEWAAPADGAFGE